MNRSIYASLDKITYLKDYQVPSHTVTKVLLTVDIFAHNTYVRSDMTMRVNPASSDKQQPLFLHGSKDVECGRVILNDKLLATTDYVINEDGMWLDMDVVKQDKTFTLSIESSIKPQNNTALEGLYKSGSLYITQCEAEGFRCINYYFDRPDVLSIFTTRISADKKACPVLLANGNPVESGDLDNGRHYAVWHDPFPKPSYLFAMVAGQLVCLQDSFTTMSGRHVDLRLYVESHEQHKCEFAMAALKRSMAWDERVYGCEYDLDVFCIVAVNDFNMGAMENKGLNIFNSDCVLADPQTATDMMHERIEGIIAHEYFHNWSGNRVTCRDWFQLSLKEGLTVFRDSQYTSDIYSATVKRIDDVMLLRTLQFAEDAGPMAHPVMLQSYMSINNFYSLTIYEKGAELVRMIYTLLGKDVFIQGVGLYFSRFDGQAVTVDDFVATMEEVSTIDLTQFKRWYHQPGTPILDIRDDYCPQSKQYTLHVSQSTPLTPEAKAKQPFHIPLRLSLYANVQAGVDAQTDTSASHKDSALSLVWPAEATAINAAKTEAVLSVTQVAQSFVFTGIDKPPVPSLLRGFSAPVKLDYAYTQAQLLFLARHDSDGFNRWEATQRLLLNSLDGVMAGQPVNQTISSEVLDLLSYLLADNQLDGSMVSRCIQLPSEAYLAERMDIIDVDNIHHSRNSVRLYLAQKLRQPLLEAYHTCQDDSAYSLDGSSIARRALKDTCLNALSVEPNQTVCQLAYEQYWRQANMTDVQSSLRALLMLDEAKGQEALDDFYTRWHKDEQVVGQWIRIQSSLNKYGGLARVQTLKQHAAFDMHNPNKVRNLFGGFIRSEINFHAQDGSGYDWIAEQIIALDSTNPIIASGLCEPLGMFRKHTADRQVAMCAQLERILQTNPSKILYEVASKSLRHN